MKTTDLPIAKPCCESWDEMDGDDIRRHCARCDKDVVNLSMLTEREVRELLGHRRPCVRYVYDSRGEIVFMHPQVRRQRRGLERLLGAAALAVPLLLGGVGCEDEAPVVFDGTEQAVAVEPWEHGDSRGESADAGASQTPGEGASVKPQPPSSSRSSEGGDAPLTDAEKKMIELLGADRYTVGVMGEPMPDG